MEYSSLPIYAKKAESVQIAREKLIKVFSDIALQYFQTDGQKVKISNLFLEVRTHRAILEDKTDPDKYFEIHFDKVVRDPQPIQRGFFRKEVYKLEMTYQPVFSFQLKDGKREAFEEPYNVMKQAFLDSKYIVRSSAKGGFVRSEGPSKATVTRR